MDVGKCLDKFTLQQLLYCTYGRKKNSEEYMKLVVYGIRRRSFEAGARQREIIGIYWTSSVLDRLGYWLAKAGRRLMTR